MKNNWPTKKLGEVADIRIGGTPSRSNPQYWGGNNAWGTISELNGQTIYDTKEHITNLGVNHSNVKPIPAGTTLMSFKLSIGKVATAGTELYTNEAIAGLIPKTNDVENKWLYYSLPTINYDRYISGAAKGKTLNKAILQEVELPIPPITNQKKIVERLDTIRKAQELCDTQISKTEELFESLVISEFQSLRAKLKSLKDITVKITKGTTPTTYGYSFTGSGVSFLRVEDIDNGELRFETTKYHISEETNDFMNRSQTQPGDVLITIAGTIGRVAVVPKNAPVLNMNQAVALIRPTSGVLSAFLKLILMSNAVKNQILKSKVTGTLTNLSLTQLGNLEIPLPSLEKQQQIVEKLGAVQNYKKLLLKQKELLKELFDSVLHKSMKGELD